MGKGVMLPRIALMLVLIFVAGLNAQDTAVDSSKVIEGNQVSDCKFLTFDFLTGYEYIPPSGYRTAGGVYNTDDMMSVWDRIPEQVIDLNGEDVIISGYIEPFKWDSTGISVYVLKADREACCFDQSLEPNQFIVIQPAPGKSLPEYYNVLVVVKGQFRIKEIIEDNLVVSLYHLSARDIYRNSD